MKTYRYIAFIVIFSALTTFPATASHIIGGEFTYKYLGDTSIGTVIAQKYQVKLDIFEDCQNGQPEAIMQDNPAFLAAYVTGSTLPYNIDTAVFFSASIRFPATIDGPCGVYEIPSCILRKTFIKTYFFPASSSGYTISYQRCCLTAAISNISDPGNSGSTYTCSIPPHKSASHNSSAVFNAYPPVFLAINKLLDFDHSASDADGDSLSYQLCYALNGATDANIKPLPGPPPFSLVTYLPGYSYDNPISCTDQLKIDAKTGRLFGTPNKLGRYLVAICCSEYRSGILINTITREFQFMVIDGTNFSYRPSAGKDTTLMAGESAYFHAADASTYQWTPADYLSNTNIPDPIGNFPVPGYFTYVLKGTQVGGCISYDTVHVWVLAYSGYNVPSAFTPDGDGRNDLLRPIPVKDSRLVSFKIFNRYGNLVFTTTSQDAGWDGNYNGTHQDMGVYYWELVYEDNTNMSRMKKGSVTLIR